MVHKLLNYSKLKWHTKCPHRALMAHWLWVAANVTNRHFSWHFGTLSTPIHGINPYVWSLLILLDPPWLLVGLLPSWWSNLRENLHHNSYATKIQCGIFFALWRQLFGCVVILKMTSARGLFLGRATSPSSLSCCPPPHLTHTHTRKCTHTIASV